MPADLASCRYPITWPFASLYGSATNVAQANLQTRSNAEHFGFGNTTDGALAATGVACAVPVPVDLNVTYSKVSLIVGATAGASITNQFVAVYQGSGAAPNLIGQSTDTTSAAIPASTVASWSLASPVTITSTHAPFGFVYVVIAITAGTVPTAATVSVPTAVNYKWFTSGPLGLSLTAGSSLAGTAAPTLVTPAAKATAPLVFLR